MDDPAARVATPTKSRRQTLRDRVLDAWSTTRESDPLHHVEGWGLDQYDDMEDLRIRLAGYARDGHRDPAWSLGHISPWIPPERRSYWDPTTVPLSPMAARKKREMEAKKEAFLRLASAGLRVKAIMDDPSVNISQHTYARWRRDDPEWTTRLDRIRAGLEDELTFRTGDFASTRRYFFGYDTFTHHALMNDAIQACPAGGITLILVPPEAGKGLALDTPLPTPTGWTTMGNVERGTVLLDDQGRPTRVLAVSPIHHRPCFRITFSDGTAIVTDDEHRWLTRTRKPQRQQSVKTTAEIAATVVAHGRPNHGIPVARPLDLPDVDLPIDPYVLGAWLGDGHSADGRITTGDPEIVTQFELAGYEMRKHNSPSPTYCAIGLRVRLRALGVLNDKHIPAAYLRASFKQRLALLQGLMDTDGYCQQTRGGCEYTTTSPYLANGVEELARTLGLKVRVKHGVATLNGVPVGPKWRVIFTPRDIPVFRLARKLERQLPLDAPNDRGHWETIVAVEPVPTVPTKCIYVDSPSHLFLATSAFKVTHNTTFVEDFLCDHIANNPSSRTLYVSDRSGDGSMSQKVLSTLKDRMTDPHLEDPNAPDARIAEWQARFGPFRDEVEDKDKPWNQNYIKVHKASGRRDYTFQACGWRSRVYGARADLLICDDIQSEETLGQTDAIYRRLTKTFFTRARRGRTIIIGTRIGAGDIYEKLITELDGDDDIDFELVLIPALDEEGNSYCPEMWPVASLAKTRKIVGEDSWWTAYMMQPRSAEDATFSKELIASCFNFTLPAGPDALGHLTSAWTRIAHLDPALGGGNALTVTAFTADKFRILDLFLDYRLTRNEEIFARIEEAAARFRFTTLVIERNSQQKGIARDDRLRDLSTAYGFEIVEHETGANKWDAAWGIRSMATSFIRRDIEIPQGDDWTVARLKALIDQLEAWRPDTSPKLQRQDAVMSLWFGWRHWMREKEAVGQDTNAMWRTRGTPWNPGDMTGSWGRRGRRGSVSASVSRATAHR